MAMWLGPPPLRTSGFADDVMFSHNGPMARHIYTYAAIEHESQEYKFCSATNIRKVLVAHWVGGGAKSAIYSCRVSAEVVMAGRVTSW